MNSGLVWCDFNLGTLNFNFLIFFLQFFLLFLQNWLFMEKKSGISFRQGIENIQTVQGRTGQQEPGTGRRPGQTSTLESPRHLGLKRHSCSTLAKLLKELKPIGSCTSTALQMSIGRLPRKTPTTWGYLLYPFAPYWLWPNYSISSN